MMEKTLKDLILEKGKDETKVILDEGKLAAKSLYDNLINENKKQLENKKAKKLNEFNSTLNLAKNNAKRSLVEETSKIKQDLIESVFINLKEYLLNLNDKELFNYILNKIKSVNLNKDEIISVNKNDYEKYKKVLSTKKGKLIDCDLLNQKLGDNYQIKLTNEEASINNGFLLMGKDFDYNFSFDESLELLQNKYEKIIYEDLK
ncbi:MAG: hypothetical protein WC907_04420 [Acholeplasmataceae bacterium]